MDKDFIFTFHCTCQLILLMVDLQIVVVPVAGSDSGNKKNVSDPKSEATPEITEFNDSVPLFFQSKGIFTKYQPCFVVEYIFYR